jgi:hypothetical protein
MEIVRRKIRKRDGPVGIKQDYSGPLTGKNVLHPVQRVRYLDSSLAAGVNTVTAADAAAVGNGGPILLYTYGVNRTDPDTGVAFLAAILFGVNDLHGSLNV